jgi:hypothetical protein
MEVRKVTSSNIDSIGYDSATKTLKVIFKNGHIYDYYGVSDQVHEALMSAESIGKFFNTNIRNSYQYGKVGQL